MLSDSTCAESNIGFLPFPSGYFFTMRSIDCLLCRLVQKAFLALAKVKGRKKIILHKHCVVIIPSLSSGNTTMQVASEQLYLQFRIMLLAKSLQFHELPTGPRYCRLTCDSMYAVYPYTQSLKRGVKINTTHSTLKLIQVEFDSEKRAHYYTHSSLFVLCLRLRIAFNLKKAFAKASRPSDLICQMTM
jgi:hypothetical protein